MEAIITIFSFIVGFSSLRWLGNKASSIRAKNGWKVSIFMMAFFSSVLIIPTEYIIPSEDILLEAVIWLTIFFIVPGGGILLGKSESDKQNHQYGATETAIYIGSIFLSMGLISVLDGRILG